MPLPVSSKSAPKTFDPKAVNDSLFAKMGVWMRPDQVAAVLGDCSVEHVRHLRLSGKLECRDFRNEGAAYPCWRFYRDSVREYLAKLPTGKPDWL